MTCLNFPDSSDRRCLLRIASTSADGAHETYGSHGSHVPHGSRASHEFLISSAPISCRTSDSCPDDPSPLPDASGRCISASSLAPLPRRRSPRRPKAGARNCALDLFGEPSLPARKLLWPQPLSRRSKLKSVFSCFSHVGLSKCGCREARSPAGKQGNRSGCPTIAWCSGGRVAPRWKITADPAASTP